MTTDDALDMVQVGETTGALGEMLSDVADFLDEEVEVKLQRILSLLEPVMLVIMGLIVAALLAAVYLPLFGLLGDARHLGHGGALSLHQVSRHPRRHVVGRVPQVS